MTKWIRRSLPVLALVAIAFAAWFVWGGYDEPPVPRIPSDDLPTSPFPRAIAGSGIVEARRKNVAIGAPASGIVLEVFVEEGQRVAKDDPLFRIDDRELQAQKLKAEAALAQAAADLARIKSLPREEEIPVYDAAVVGAEATLKEKKGKLERIRNAAQTVAVTAQEVDTAVREVDVAQADLDRAKAQRQFFLAGASAEEIAVAESAAAVARSEVDALRTQIEIRTIRAPDAGRVLDLEVRPGEFVSGQQQETLILFAREGALQVRATIDEYDIPRFDPRAKAVGTLKGNNDKRISLVFDHVEPYVIPKQSLTGESTERIDTRVLPIVYQVADSDSELYVGQQIDIFIEDLSESDDKAAVEPKEADRGETDS
jgi:multidrug efflux pump subunit AcrA (membrane-fusion protein)